MVNTIKGTTEDDNLRGTAGDDLIIGGFGEDVLSGLAGRDTLIGGGGDDILRGGGGADTFVFRTGYDRDQIDDFSFRQGDGLDLRQTTFGLDDLRDRDAGGTILDHDRDGNYLRESSSNGAPEVTFYFGNDDGGFDSLTILGVTIRELRQDVKAHPDHYDFFV